MSWRSGSANSLSLAPLRVILSCYISHLGWPLCVVAATFDVHLLPFYLILAFLVATHMYESVIDTPQMNKSR